LPIRDELTLLDLEADEACFASGSREHEQAEQ
jgi:hypothetical protein